MTPGVRTIFIDMNSFYASVEMQDNPGFRGKPTIVVPVMTDSSCAIAASYQAKKLGIKTGTPIVDAKKICPNINVVLARPLRYLQIHQQIYKILQNNFDIVKPLSIDEFACHIPFSTEQKCLNYRDLIQKEITDSIGHELNASFGCSSNIFLSKIASEIIKPNGFVYFEAKDALSTMKNLKIEDLPGIASKMKVRLNSKLIFTIEDLFAKTDKELKYAFGSIIGEYWWHMLRGSLNPDYGMWHGKPLKSIGHSHVVPPDMRNIDSAYEIYKSLVEKSFDRIIKHDLYPSRLSINVGNEFSDTSFKHTNLIDRLRFFADEEWKKISPNLKNFKKISITWYNLHKQEDVIQPLFALETLNQFSLSYDVPDRISFGDPNKKFNY
jgi:DNA polymerase-4